MRKLGGTIGTALLLVAVGAGCGESEASPEADPTPVVNKSVTLSAPDGSHVEQCWFPSDSSERGRTVALVVPDSLYAGEVTDTECRFKSLTKPSEHAAVVTVGVTEELGRYKEKYVDRYVSDGGDDATNNVAYDDAATIFDGRRGATLAFDVHNDGLPQHRALAQFEDVRITWVVPGKGFPDTAYDDAEISAGLAGVQIVEDAPRPR